ncbi:MAG: PfkB family carbohydrate kinase, partial [Bifidobacterium sp.]|nr:PfkB family carbohydrate kinase [Bifidobacterium sp.]
IALTDVQAERTFISTRGAECFGGADAFDGVEPADGDIVHLSGYTLAHPIAAALAAFLARTPRDRRAFRAVFDPGPLVADFDGAWLRRMVDYGPLWTCNEREAGVLARRLGCEPGGLACCLGAPVVVRRGARGAQVMVPCLDGGATSVVNVPGYPARALDTNGAGDCHTGVLCAALLDGLDLCPAVRLANAASAIAVTRRGPATCPTRAEARALMDGDGVVPSGTPSQAHAA